MILGVMLVISSVGYCLPRISMVLGSGEGLAKDMALVQANLR